MPRRQKSVHYGRLVLNFKPRERNKKCAKLGKVSYVTEMDAKLALANIKRADSRNRSAASNRVEKRAYKCPHGNHWHLTHIEKFIKEKKNNGK